MAVAPPSGAGGQAAPASAEPAPAAVGKTAEKQDAVSEKKPGGDAAAAVTPNLPGAQVDPLNGGSMLTGMSAKTGFGYDVLGGKSSVITDGPIDDSYLITPGDEIVVSIWGELTEMLNLVVSREGYIDLPQGGGRIPTNGMTLGELRPQIMRALAQIYAAFINVVEPSKSTAFVDIRLGKLNELTVFVLGEVQTPGNYRIMPGAANVINLINNAGGAKTTGSLRTVEIHRSNGVVDTVDLYRFFLSGDLDLKLIRVRQGDHIVVPLKRKSVSIEGEVLRPHNFELVGNEGLRELVELAGGFKPDAYAKQVQLRRFELNKGEVLVDVDLDEVMRDPAKNVPLMNGDTISITKNVQVRKNSVSIKGDGITRSGTYEWTPGMTLGDLINKANGLREYAYLDRADLIRTEDDFSKKLMVIRLADFYKRDESGSYVFSGTPEQNLPLREMDEIIIQSLYGMSGKDPHISMEGHVKEPGRFVLARDMTLYDFIFARGGFQDEGFRKSTFLDNAHIFRRVPGEVGKKIISFNLGALLNNDPEANQPLQEEDIIRIYSAEEMGRRLEVSIDGLVNKPGKFPMSEELTLEDLLVMAGGLQPGTENLQAVIARADVGGQNRSIVVPVDIKFYALPKERRTVLESNDKISIVGLGAKDRYVALEGHVKAPGKFIFAKDMTLKDLIATRGGFQDPAFRNEVFPDVGHIFRKVPGELSKKIITFNVGELLNNVETANLSLQEDDIVRIYSVEEMGKRAVVTLDGLVNKPGEFPMSEDLTLEDLLVMAGGLQPGAELAQAVIARADVEGNSRSIVVPVDPRFTLLPKDRRTRLEAKDKVSIVGLGARDRYVSLEGHVQNPGKFVLTKDMTLKDLISTRAGFQDASFRRAVFPDMAHIFRKVPGQVGKKIIPFNVGALLDNDSSANQPLEEEDIVRIYSFEEMRTDQRVTIDGLVKQPGTFPMAEGMTLEDLIMMAGGLVPKAFKVEATIARSERDITSNQPEDHMVLTTQRVPIDMKNFANLPREQRTPVKPDDRITVRALPDWERSSSVLIEGEVTEPGHYSLAEKNETLSMVVRRAGGLKESALPEGATVERRREGTATGADPDVSGHLFRIPVNIRAALDKPKGADDIVLKADDRIVVPSNPGVVEVRGAVRRKLSLKHVPGRTLAEYVDLCGGYLEKADIANIRVFTANQTALPVKVAASGKKGRSVAGLIQDIPAGSVIEVPFIRATEQLQTVDVKGAVNKPALIQHIAGAPLGYYLTLSGGFAPDADLESISVLLPDGGLLVKTGNQPFNPVIPGGSQIMVTRKTLAPTQ